MKFKKAKLSFTDRNQKYGCLWVGEVTGWKEARGNLRVTEILCVDLCDDHIWVLCIYLSTLIDWYV